MDDAREVATFLVRHGLILATAESCTAGLMASRIAEVSGSGKSLCLAIVTYAPEAKTGVLGVAQDVIDRHGLTSEPVSLAMARGVLRLCRADLAVANTGVADGGAQDDTPPGTQCFAWIFRMPGNAETLVEFSDTQRFEGDRNAVRMAAADWGLLRIPHYYTLAQRQKLNQSDTTDR